MTPRVFSGCALLVACLLLTGPAAPASEKPTQARPRSRTFTFTYAGSVTGLKPGQQARVWLPVPPSNGDQEVTLLSQDLPAEAKEGAERRFGNRMLSFEAKADDAGRVPFRVNYRVTRHEVKGQSVKAMEEDLAALEKFLRADAMVPVGGKPLELIKGRELPRDQTEAARVLYDAVNGHMRYAKEGTGWGRGDAVWAC